VRTYIVSLISCFSAATSADHCASPAYPSADLVRQGFQLSQPLQIAEIEMQSMAPGVAGSSSLVPFGASNKRWSELKHQLRDSDTIHKAAKSGFGEMYVVIRAGCVVDGFRTVVVN